MVRYNDVNTLGVLHVRRTSRYWNHIRSIRRYVETVFGFLLISDGIIGIVVFQQDGAQPQVKVLTTEHLTERNLAAATEITSAQLENVLRSTVELCGLCLDTQGGHIETY